MANVNKNDLFQQASMRICGNLDIGKALLSCVQYLREILPLDRIFLQRYDSGFKAMRTIGTATHSAGRMLDLLTPLSAEAMTASANRYETPLPSVLIFNEPESQALSREMLRFHGVNATSLMGLFLESEGERLGSIVFSSEGPDRYNAKHAELVTLLKEPFVIAMSNALQHLEILKFKEMLADDNRYLHDEIKVCRGFTRKSHLCRKKHPMSIMYGKQKESMRSPGLSTAKHRIRLRPILAYWELYFPT